MAYDWSKFGIEFAVKRYFFGGNDAFAEYSFSWYEDAFTDKMHSFIASGLKNITDTKTQGHFYEIFFLYQFETSAFVFIIWNVSTFLKVKTINLEKSVLWFFFFLKDFCS